jgi:hypothetical protein
MLTGFNSLDIRLFYIETGYGKAYHIKYVTQDKFRNYIFMYFGKYSPHRKVHRIQSLVRSEIHAVHFMQEVNGLCDALY